MASSWFFRSSEEVFQFDTPDRGREHGIILQHQQRVAVQVIRSKKAVSDFLDGLDAERAVTDDG